MKNFSVEDLDKQGEAYKDKGGANQSAYIYRYRYEIIKKRMTGPDVLELGIGHADVTNWLIEDKFFITSVDGANTVIEHAKEKIIDLDKVQLIHSYFEDLDLDVLFNDVLLNNCLEHVDNPIAVMSHVKKFMKDGGRMHITVPNATSIHRMLGVEMGMINSENSLNAHDIKVGHQRVYTIDLMKEHINKSGLEIIDQDGIIIKPFSNSQMNHIIDKYGNEVLDGLFKLGSRLPELATEMYFCCRRM